ncbi:hypothetical protein [Archaeoglobus sulfaticallidus]|nr:hypothetical protein [Archaeoglobus sulfaticallidus]
MPEEEIPSEKPLVEDANLMLKIEDALTLSRVIGYLEAKKEEIKEKSDQLKKEILDYEREKLELEREIERLKEEIKNLRKEKEAKIVKVKKKQRFLKRLLGLGRKNEIEIPEEELRLVLAEVDRLLGFLPEEVVAEFSQTEEGKKYLELLEKLGV